MRLVLVGMLLTVSVVAFAPFDADPATRVIQADRDRISAHLRAVEARLRAAPVSHLTPAQQRARAQNLDRLREYRRRALYPHNHDFEHRTPYFRDHHGTLCAMAYLIERSGSGDLVDRVAAEANNAYIADLAGDPELAAWLERNGITVEEAALIQPMYGGYEEPEPSLFGRMADNYGAYGMATLMLDAGALALNHPALRAGAAPELTGALAVAAGTFGSVSSLIGITDGSVGREVLGLLNLGAGVVTAAVGVQSILSGFEEPPQPGIPAGQSAPPLDVKPMLLDGRAGVGFSMRF